MTAPVTYISNWISPEAAEDFFARLDADLAWQRRENTPRSEYWANTFQRPYTYGSGRGVRTYEAQPSHEVIDLVRDHIARDFGPVLEGCFLNRYNDGSDALGWHADDDPGIDHSKPIAVVTLGQPRAIAFKEVLIHGDETTKWSFGPPARLMLESGSLLLMHAGMQHTHQHSIPKGDQPKAGVVVRPRISMTYRGLVPA